MSLLFAALMLAWLYRFASDLVNKRTALVATLLMSTSAFVILYFHDMRMYTMLMSLAIMHTWLYWRLSTGDRVTRLTWILFVATTGTLLYIHNFSTILFIGLGVHHLLFVKKSRRWMRIIVFWGLGVLTFLPYVPYVIAGLGFNQSVTNNPLSTAEVAKTFRIFGGKWLGSAVDADTVLLWLRALAASQPQCFPLAFCVGHDVRGHFACQLALQYHNY